MKKVIPVLLIVVIPYCLFAIAGCGNDKTGLITGPDRTSENEGMFIPTQDSTEAKDDNDPSTFSTNADYITYPINPWYPLNGYAFGRWVSNRGYHLGDDCVRSSGTAVYAISNGYVKYARYHGGGWGYMMIVESMVNNILYATVYGHLGSRMYPGEGHWVSRGQYIGTVGSTAESGQSSPHLHLGIKRLSSSWPTGQYPSWCKGYTTSYSEMQTWINPSAFIAYW